MTKKLFIKTFGCQMNVYDSARMADVLAPLGYVATDAPEEADLLVLNTCHIRERASEKLFSELGVLKSLKSQDRQVLIAVAGCVAQAEGALVAERAPFVDFVVGPQSYHQLPELIARAAREADGAVGGRAPRAGLGILAVDFPVEPKFDHLPPPRHEGVSAFLSVQEGCDKFCSFCVVPFTRGAEYSRPVEAVVAEARHLVDQGARELTLLGQNVNAYHGQSATGATWGLGRLIRHLAEIDGLARIRYTTSHPRDMDDDLIAAHGEVPALMPFLHLPVQSGSDRILAAMNRKHTADDYHRLIDRLRASRPDIALSSDFIVGYPGETAADFQATLRLVAEIGFAQAFSFRFSARPGTVAATLPPVPDHEASGRLQDLLVLLREQQFAFNAATVGRTVALLIEKAGRHPGQLVGRTPHFQSVHVEGPRGDPARLIGAVLPATITAAAQNSLAGSLCTGDVAGHTPEPARATA